MKDQVSYPYKTTGKIIFLYTLIFIFLDIKLEDKMLQKNRNKHCLKEDQESVPKLKDADWYSQIYN
jgi:hypothetical protein